MKNYVGRGEVIFSIALAYFFTWYNALNLTSWGWREGLALVWAALLNFVVVFALLWVCTLLTKHPIFGRKKAFYFPYKSILVVSLIVSLLFGLIYYISDHQPLKGFHLLIYIIGYVLGVVAMMLCIYFLTRKEGNK
jgi:hypothetical protein